MATPAGRSNEQALCKSFQLSTYVEEQAESSHYHEEDIPQSSKEPGSISAHTIRLRENEAGSKHRNLDREVWPYADFD